MATGGLPELHSPFVIKILNIIINKPLQVLNATEDIEYRVSKNFPTLMENKCFRFRHRPKS